MAETAALAWIEAVTETPPEPGVVVSLHETAVCMLAGFQYGEPSDVLIRAAADAVAHATRPAPPRTHPSVRSDPPTAG